MMKVVDLNAGLGGRALAFKNAGYEIAQLVEVDKVCVDYLKKEFGDDKVYIEDARYLYPEAVVDADIILYKYYTGRYSVERGFNEQYQRDINGRIAEIILDKKPLIFIVEVPSSALKGYNKENVKKFFGLFTAYGYRVSSKLLYDEDFSGYSSNANRVYFFGIRMNDVIDIFKKNIVSKRKLKFDDVPWNSKYRVEIPNELSVEIGEWYVKDFKGYKKTNIVSMTYAQEMYVADGFGLRRFTHNEIARVKGLINQSYNNPVNMDSMYRKLKAGSNVFVYSSFAENIKKIDLYEREKNNRDYSAAEKTVIEYKKNDKMKNDNKNMGIPKLFLRQIDIQKLKGLSNVTINFDENRPLVALMGLNGVGKSTILHALACIYKPHTIDGELPANDYKFSYFFTPNPDATWKDSSFKVTSYDVASKKIIVRDYKKASDRWTPRYVNRPERDIYYIGIQTCVPEIELEKRNKILYTSSAYPGKTADNIRKDAAFILQKGYDELSINDSGNKKLVGVVTSDKIKYSSISMGAGEQRVFKILDIVYKAMQYSLILIDEIDLLLHIAALDRLIERLYKIAIERKLQIVFTTHSPEMQDLRDFVDIRYLQKVENRIFVYKEITYDLLCSLSNKYDDRPLVIYVEDLYAKAIVEKIALQCKAARYIDVVNFGAIENGFTVAASYMLREDEMDNVLVVLDGDLYRTDEEKIKQLKGVLSGTEENHDNKIQSILGIIKQFDLPEGKAPEEFIHDLLIHQNATNEVVICAKEIEEVKDTHQYVKYIQDRLNMGKNEYGPIIEAVEKTTEWKKYIKPIKDWINKRVKEKVSGTLEID